LRSAPSFLLSGIAELYIGARSVLITRGWRWDRSPSALRNRRLAASASRNARRQEIDGGALGINGPIQVAPATLHANVGFAHSPRLVCRLETPSQSLLQLRTVILHPAPNRCVIDIETALLQQFLNIAQRERIAKIPPDRTEYEAGFGLPPFEDRESGSHFPILSRHQPATLKVATHRFATSTATWPRPVPRSTSSSKRSTTANACTRPSAMCRPPSTRLNWPCRIRRPLRGSLLHEFFQGIGKSIDPMSDGKAGSGFGRPLPALIGVDESPSGYSLEGCAPAESASASPADIRML